MRPDIYNVIDIDQGFLAVMAKPVAGEWIEEQFQGISIFGIKRMVSLLERHEIRELGLASAKNLCQVNAIEYINFPIQDRGLPKSSTEVYTLADMLLRGIQRGENTVIHCRAGIGRTGLIAASVLVRSGYSAVEAFRLISRARGVQVPDTTEQYDWVVKNQRMLQVNNK